MPPTATRTLARRRELSRELLRGEYNTAVASNIFAHVLQIIPYLFNQHASCPDTVRPSKPLDRRSSIEQIQKREKLEKEEIFILLQNNSKRIFKNKRNKWLQL